MISTAARLSRNLSPRRTCRAQVPASAPAESVLSLLFDTSPQGAPGQRLVDDAVTVSEEEVTLSLLRWLRAPLDARRCARRRAAEDKMPLKKEKDVFFKNG